MIDLILRQGTMNYKKNGIRIYKTFLCLMALFLITKAAFGSTGSFECTDGSPANRSFLSLNFTQIDDEEVLFRFRILPFMRNGKANENVSSFLKGWGISTNGFQRPIFELSLKASQCRVLKESEAPLVDCFLGKGTRFKVRDTLTNKTAEGVLSWGQFHMRRQVETFVMFRSEDGQFKKSHESIKIFFTGQNKKREISRLDSVYYGQFCHWN